MPSATNARALDPSRLTLTTFGSPSDGKYFQRDATACCRATLPARDCDPTCYVGGIKEKRWKTLFIESGRLAEAGSNPGSNALALARQGEQNATDFTRFLIFYRIIDVRITDIGRRKSLRTAGDV
ncbi:MAG: hypothetical protein LBQ54_04450 [Planctomycetaceae bacterium]|nr:hypothetical protein [Planctomycetaceae bacterium]